MGFIKDLVNKLFNKLGNRAATKVADKVADKAVDTILGKDKRSQQYSPAEEPSTSLADTKEQQLTNQEAALAQALLEQQKAMLQFATVNQTAALASTNEIMQYFKLDDDMNIIGVKDDAPDYIKKAYLNSKKEA